MGGVIEYDCVNCGTEDRMARSSFNLLTNATGLEEDEAKVCGDCLPELLSDESVMFDLSIGGRHTRSKEFEAQREKRKQQRDEDELQAAKNSSVIVFEGTYVYDDREEGPIDVAKIDLPKKAKADLKAMNYQRVKYGWDDDRRCWRCKLDVVDDVVDHLEDEGWTVEVHDAVRDAQ